MPSPGPPPNADKDVDDLNECRLLPSEVVEVARQLFCLVRQRRSRELVTGKKFEEGRVEAKPSFVSLF